MFPLAHIAAALAVNKLVLHDEHALTSITASLLPDAIDKTLAWVLKVTTSSHFVAHTPLAAAGASFVVGRTIGPEAGKSFGLAYAAHLVTDDLHHGRVPWRLPFSRATRLPRRASTRRLLIGLSLEVLALPLIWWLLDAKSLAGGPSAKLDGGALSGIDEFSQP